MNRRSHVKRKPWEVLTVEGSRAAGGGQGRALLAANHPGVDVLLISSR